MKIGTLTLASPYILAPLAGFTDLPFRLLCREYGAGLCYSEMISCHGLHYRQESTVRLTATIAEERPVALQLFGSEPDIMADGAAMISKMPIDIIDINMGCPVKKVIKKGAGAALMKEPDLAAKIIAAVCAQSSKPVTVKIRTGWNHQNINAMDFAKMAEDNGASAVAVHARTWTDGFSGTVDWQVIRKVKQVVNIPVIGNGDVLSYADGQRMLAETGCDGVMIGRAALGAPWIFQPGSSPNPPRTTRLTALHRHLELIEQHLPADRMLGKIKNHAGRYFRGIPGGAAIRKQLYEIKTFAILKELIRGMLGNS
ncbi:tRNA dihydrouridine synthase DusB [Thermodesulfobacteriota bacterium]